MKYIGLIALLSLAGCGTDHVQPSFILLSLDTLRADHMEPYGYTRDTTPYLDKLAEKGWVFDQAVTVTCHTLISHASMLTGLYPGALGFVDMDHLHPVQAAYTTLAEDFRAAGYQTAGFTAHSTWLNEGFGFDQGFDTFSSTYRCAESILSDARDWLEQIEKDKPYYLFIHLYDVHSDFEGRPYQAPPPFHGRYTDDYSGTLEPWASQPVDGSRFLRDVHDGKIEITDHDLGYLRNQYDEGLAYTDHAVGRFLEGLTAKDNVYLVITADHGEEFQDHGGMLHCTSYDEVIRVPLIIVPPDASRPQRLKDQVCITDIRPTLLALAGLPKARICQGVDLSMWLQGRSAECPSGPVPLNVGSAMRYKGYKFLRKTPGSPPLLFDLTSDPLELNSICDQDESTIEIALYLHQQLNDLHEVNTMISKKLFNPGSENSHSVENAEDIKRLKDLGYL